MSAAANTSCASGAGAASVSLSPLGLHARSAFLAGDETVRIVPSFNYKSKLGLISRSVGPFRAGVDAPVPLWLAVHLRRRNLCRIIPPAWMDVEALKGILKFERDPNEASFSPDLPFRHAEVARAVLGACGSGGGTGSGASGSGGGGDGDGAVVEIPDADAVKLLLEDVTAVRADKIRRNVHTLSAQSMSRDDGAPLPVIDVTNIGSLEVQAVRPFILRAFRDHRSLTGRDPVKQAAGGELVGNGGRNVVSGGVNEAREAQALRGRRAAAKQEEAVDEGSLETPTAVPASNARSGGRSRIRRFR